VLSLKSEDGADTEMAPKVLLRDLNKALPTISEADVSEAGMGRRKGRDSVSTLGEHARMESPSSDRSSLLLRPQTAKTTI
jgi:hypothetical protein